MFFFALGSKNNFSFTYYNPLSIPFSISVKRSAPVTYFCPAPASASVLISAFFVTEKETEFPSLLHMISP